MSKPSIPRVRTGQFLLDQAMAAIKETLDAMTGQARNVEKLPPLASDATSEQIIARINALTERMQ